MLAVLAEFERDLISERTTSAMNHLRRTGRRISGRIPFGYDLRGDMLVSNPMEQAVIDLVGRLRSKGLSLREIAQDLRRRGMRTKGGSPEWSPKVLAAVIRRAEKTMNGMAA
jgi:DNA invertase Pin-like site-specific DNA recombinase